MNKKHKRIDKQEGKENLWIRIIRESINKKQRRIDE